MKYNLAIALLMILIASCQKKDNVDTAIAQVNIAITSPQDGQIFKSADTVYIKANVDYPTELHGYEVMITDTSTGFIVYDDAQHIHTDKFVIDDAWIGTVTQSTSLKLSIIAYIDHNGNEAKKDLNIYLEP